MSQIIVRDLDTYVAELQTRVVIARDLVVYAVDQGSPVAVVRQSLGAIMRPVRKPDFTKTRLSALYAALTKDFQLTLDASTVVFVNPRAGAAGSSFNSLVTASPAPGAPYIGSYDFRYDRYQMSDAFAGKTPSTFTVSADSTIYALLPQINSFFGLNLEQSDVNDGPVSAATGTFTLTAASTSFGFQPGSTIVLGHAP